MYLDDSVYYVMYVYCEHNQLAIYLARLGLEKSNQFHSFGYAYYSGRRIPEYRLGFGPLITNLNVGDIAYRHFLGRNLLHSTFWKATRSTRLLCDFV